MRRVTRSLRHRITGMSRIWTMGLDTARAGGGAADMWGAMHRDPVHGLRH